LIIATALTAGLLTVTSETVRGFNIVSDGSRAIFSFRDSNWDAVFGTISLREMNDKLNAVLTKSNELQQELNATRAELNAFKSQQAVRYLIWPHLKRFRSKTSCKTTTLLRNSMQLVPS
jgi:hypothetical protein